MRAIQLILIVAAFAAIGVFGTVAWYFSYYFYDYQEIPMNYTVRSGVAGIVTDTDALKMGTMPPAGGSQRSVVVTAPHDSRIVVGITGNASRYAVPDPIVAFVRAGEKLQVNFTVSVPYEAPQGYYEGVAAFRFYRSKI